ncbi:MAG: hypothetical protein A2X80_09415 [Geobacteraceae bacterium GWB2_52_12]|nr:MAG: hypothetical protein A2X80_09415 [Geobacteraceae bacterium GWB2_52_12]
MSENGRTDNGTSMLKSYISCMEELLSVLEQTSLVQARTLEFRNVILATQMETSIDGILVVDGDDVIISHNRRFAEMWGLDAGTIKSRHHVQALQSVLPLLTDPALFVARLHYLYEHREETGHDEIALKDGRVFDRYSAPMKGADGDYYGRVWYLRDITDHLLADLALRESEEKFRAVADAAPDAVIMVDNKGAVQVWNKAAERIFGYSSAEALGKSIHRLVIPPGFRKEHLRGFHSFRKSGQGALVLKTVEVPAVRKDGAEIPVELSLAAIRLKGKWCATAIARDISERRQAEETMRKLSLAVEGSSDWILITDKNGIIEYANRAVEVMSGYRREELLGQTPRIFKSGNHNELFYSELWATILSGRTFLAIISNRGKNGGLFEVFHTITPLRDSAGAITHFVSTAKDMTQQKHLEEKIRLLAYYDELTGLPNRAFHRELMVKTIEHARRYGQMFGALCIDLDNFKRINDTLGLSVGDLLLKTMADRLSTFLRSSDFTARPGGDETVELLYRLGGDEYLVLLQNIGQAKDAALVAGRLLRELARPCILNGQEVFITASIGISLYPDDGENVDDLLKNADAAMYLAKDQGRNNYQFYSKSHSAAVFETLTLESKLRRGLDHGELVLFYQPKLDATTRAIHGMEALIRWMHPEKGMIMPGSFIPFAETSDLIVQIGEFTLRTACRQVKLWLEAGFKPACVAVNVSGRQFGRTDLIEVVKGALQQAGISPGHLELEITEGTIMRNPEEAIRTMHRLKEMGIRLTIDDFGTGYSSLNYLKQFPLDFLKIDQSFVRNVATSHSDRAIIRAIIAMAHSLNLKLVAEGVETEEQFSFLREQGCDELQGFLFSRPVAAEAFSALLERGVL